MNISALLKIFDEAMERTQLNGVPVHGWLEKVPNQLHYRFRVNASDITSYQNYYDEEHYVGCIFDFTESELTQIRECVDFEFDNANAFYIAPNSMIHPHTDNSPKRSQKTTIVNLTGCGSILRLHDSAGNIIFELPEVIDKYTLYPSKVIHSYEVKDIAARLINFWHD